MNSYIKKIDKGKLFRYLSEELQCQLLNTTIALTDIPKGVLLLHESKEVMGLRLKEIHLQNTEENRRKYRSLILSTNINEFISGIALNEEGLYQRDDEGTLFVDLIKKQAILPGFRGDTGIEKLYGIEGDFITEGLDSLDMKCKKYKEDGCRFSTWRSIFTISKSNPSIYGIKYNAQASGQFAAVCQANGIAPLIGIDISLEGEYSLKKCSKVLQTILNELLGALNEYKVFLEGVIIQSTMVRPGKNSKELETAEMADATLRVFSQVIMTSTMGIQIFSGGLTEEEATQNLNAMFHNDNHRKPWPITFAFGRALQMSFLISWNGETECETTAKKQLRKRAQALTKATVGKYIPHSVKGSASDKRSVHLSDLNAILF